MRSSKLFPISAFVLMVLFSSAAGELKPTTHKGFFLNFGFGGGTADLNEEGFQTDRKGGVTFNLRLGGALKQNLLLAGEIDAWRKEEGGAAIQFNNYAATLTYYPTQILFLKAGPAYSAATAEAFGFSETESGFGFTGGLGTELRLTQKFALIPMAQFIVQDYDGFSTNFFSITLDVGWFW
jgi:hypothetical protein